MTLLVIEDEPSKEEQIVAFIKEFFPTAVVVAERSIMSAKQALHRQEYDLVLLDMTLPLFDHDDINMLRSGNNEVDPFGGTAILDEMDRCCLQSKVVVITAFDKLGDGENCISLEGIDRQMKEDYGEMVIGTVYYDSSSLAWQEQTHAMILVACSGD